MRVPLLAAAGCWSPPCSLCVAGIYLHGLWAPRFALLCADGSSHPPHVHVSAAKPAPLLDSTQAGWPYTKGKPTFPQCCDLCRARNDCAYWEMRNFALGPVSLRAALSHPSGGLPQQLCVTWGRACSAHAVCVCPPLLHRSPPAAPTPNPPCPVICLLQNRVFTCSLFGSLPAVELTPYDFDNIPLSPGTGKITTGGRVACLLLPLSAARGWGGIPLVHGSPTCSSALGSTAGFKGCPPPPPPFPPPSPPLPPSPPPPPPSPPPPSPPPPSPPAPPLFTCGCSFQQAEYQSALNTPKLLRTHILNTTDPDWTAAGYTGPATREQCCEYCRLNPACAWFTYNEFNQVFASQVRCFRPAHCICCFCCCCRRTASAAGLPLPSPVRTAR